ncbi:MAG: hypothetical protein AAF378_15400 [Cyanobacteria bacterium P01_A01_bin.84]
MLSLWKARCINATVVVGTHDDLTNIAGLFGFEIKTIRLSTLCVENLLEWVKKLIEAQRLSPLTETIQNSKCTIPALKRK